MENSLPVPQKVKHEVTIGLNNSTPRYITRRTENTHSHKTCTLMFIVTLFVIVNKGKYIPKCIPADE